MKYILTLFLFALSGFSAFCQQVTLNGKITDDNNKPIPFSSVYVKNTTLGTSSNSDGEYTLQLKPGTYEIRYGSIGYKQENQVVKLTGNKQLNIVLQDESYQLNDVVISAKSENPAYAIIRKAINKRKQHLEEVKGYTCDVYIKGVQKLLAAPKKFMGIDIQKATNEAGLDSSRRGIIYLSESQSKYSFEQPDKVHEEMISSKVSGSNRAFSYNRASDMEINFYKNIQILEGLSNKPVISPIADNALFYYKYKLLGKTIENGETIDKIRVIPRRGYDACFQGNIYILENNWRLYGLNLFITKAQNINFVDTLRFSQQFFPVSKTAWMPSSIKFEFVGGIFSFKFSGYFISVYKNYDIDPIFAKNEFNEVLRITKEVNKKDSVFWDNERPIPLTDEEKTDYKNKAVLARKRESKRYLDSLDKVNNKFNAGAILRGYHYRNRYKHEYLNLDPLLTAVKFNTVQGFDVNYGGSFSKRIDTLNNRYLVIAAKAGYGFSDKKVTGSIYAILPVSSFTLGFKAGSEIVDLNDNDPVSPLVNTFYSLFEKENYQKLYQKQYISVSADKRITGGWLASATAEWAQRTWLPNATSYSFFNPGNKIYTSNNPLLPNQETPLFKENQSFKITFRTSYDFSDKYETLPSGRRYLPSPYPTIGINYIEGIKGALGSDVDYDLLSVDVTKSGINDGVLGQSSFYFGTGKFLNNNNLFYPDYKQFSGNQVLFYKGGINSFLLLNYYKFSTYKEYIEGHFEQNFSGFILNKIPLIRKLKLQEVVDANYLSTSALKNYTELGFGLQYLNFRLIYGKSFNSGSNINSSIRLGVNF